MPSSDIHIDLVSVLRTTTYMYLLIIGRACIGEAIRAYAESDSLVCSVGAKYGVYDCFVVYCVSVLIFHTVQTVQGTNVRRAPVLGTCPGAIIEEPDSDRWEYTVS